MFGFCLEGSISWERRMPIFRGYQRRCTINGSWITSPSATAAVSRRLPRCKRPLVIGTFMPASGRRSKYPDEISDFVTRCSLGPDKRGIQWVDATLEIYLHDFEGLNSLATVDSKETKPCLGLIEYSPGQRFFVKELWAQSIKEVLRRPSEPARLIRHKPQRGRVTQHFRGV